MARIPPRSDFRHFWREKGEPGNKCMCLVSTKLCVVRERDSALRFTKSKNNIFGPGKQENVDSVGYRYLARSHPPPPIDLCLKMHNFRHFTEHWNTQFCTILYTILYHTFTGWWTTQDWRHGIRQVRFPKHTNSTKNMMQSGEIWYMLELPLEFRHFLNLQRHRILHHVFDFLALFDKIW